MKPNINTDAITIDNTVNELRKLFDGIEFNNAGIQAEMNALALLRLEEKELSFFSKLKRLFWPNGKITQSQRNIQSAQATIAQYNLGIAQHTLSLCSNTQSLTTTAEEQTEEQ